MGRKFKSDPQGVDIRLVNLGSGAQAVLKMNKQTSTSLPERDPYSYAGNRNQHEIQMYKALNSHAVARRYLVGFIGGGEWKVEEGTTVGPSGEIAKITFTGDLTAGCGSGQLFSHEDCSMIASWGKVDWLITEKDPNTITVYDYLTELLMSLDRRDGNLIIPATLSEYVDTSGVVEAVRVAITACQAMINELHQELGFLHMDYHLKNMLIQLDGGAPKARLFDLDFSGFIADSLLEHPRVQSTANVAGVSPADRPDVLNFPMLHTIPALDMGGPACAIRTSSHEAVPRSLLELLSKIRSPADADRDPEPTRDFLHRADMFLGMMQLHEFSFPCEETEVSKLLAVGVANPYPGRVGAFLPIATEEQKEHVVKQLEYLDAVFQTKEYGEWPGQRDDAFKFAWFRVKMLAKGAVVYLMQFRGEAPLLAEAEAFKTRA